MLRLRHRIARRVLHAGVSLFPWPLISALSDRNLSRLAWFMRWVAREKEKIAVDGVRKLFKQNHPSIRLARGVVSDISRKCKNKIANNLIVNGLLFGLKKSEKYRARGIKVPQLIVISPTMRCNLLCRGCYAGEYTREEDLDFKTVDRIIREGKELGVYFYTITGGEGFVWPGLLKIFERHSDCYFQIYTNGTLIDDRMARRLARLGNVAPAISVEGFEKETDLRRGKGTFKKVMRAMDCLRRHKVLFGFSATPTRYNSELIASDEFIDFYIKKGCKFGWYFQYIPIGLKPDVRMMATPEQRQYLRKRVYEIRNTKPIFIGDFWNDGPAVEGCLAGSRDGGYLHINCHGDVEPCVFCHFAVDNIKNKSLLEALSSDFFKSIQSKQPYSDNLLTPCMIIDNPEILREIVKKTGARPTHPGAESIVNDSEIRKHLDIYSKQMHELTDDVWAEEWPEMAKMMRKQYMERIKREKTINSGPDFIKRRICNGRKKAAVIF